MAGGFAAFDRTGQLDRTTKQQQLFSERGFTRVGMGDDGEGAAAVEFVEKGGHQSIKKSLNLETKEKTRRFYPKSASNLSAHLVSSQKVLFRLTLESHLGCKCARHPPRLEGYGKVTGDFFRLGHTLAAQPIIYYKPLPVAP